MTLAGDALLLVAAVAFMLLGQFLIYPFTFYWSHRVTVPRHQAFDPDQAAGSELEELFAATVARLADRGFELVGHYAGIGRAGADRYTLLLHPSRGDAVMLVEAHVAGTVLRYLEYEARFADGSELATNNSADPPGTYVQLPTHTRLQFSWVHDPLELYELHQAAVREYFPSLAREQRTPADVERRFDSDTDRVMDHQVARGLLRTTDTPGKYDPTLRGAFHMTWKNAYPVGAIRRRLYRSRMRRVQDRLSDHR